MTTCYDFTMRKLIALILIAVLLPSAAFARYKQEVWDRKPYIQSTTTNSTVIKWQTEEHTRGKVFLAESLDELLESPRKFRELINGHDHEILIRDLKPATKYYYSVEAKAKGQKTTLAYPSANNYFITYPEKTEKPMRVWVLGDSGVAGYGRHSGEKSKYKQIYVRNAYHEYNDHETDLVLMLGDNAYHHGTAEQYQRAVFEIYQDTMAHASLWPSFGNHDYGEYIGNRKFNARSFPKPEGVYYENFVLPEPEAYYSFNHGDIHFIALDSTDSMWLDGQKKKIQWSPESEGSNKMLDWLKEDLANDKSKWRVAFWHHNVYGNFDKRHRENIWMRDHVLPILEQAGVDLVLNGHSHRYARSYLLKDGKILNKEYKKQDNEGTVYVIAGSSGKLRKKKQKSLDIYSKEIYEYGSLILDIDSEKLIVKFINDEAKQLDRFTIVK